MIEEEVVEFIRPDQILGLLRQRAPSPSGSSSGEIGVPMMSRTTAVKAELFLKRASYSNSTGIRVFGTEPFTEYIAIWSPL